MKMFRNVVCIANALQFTVIKSATVLHDTMSDGLQING